MQGYTWFGTWLLFRSHFSSPVLSHSTSSCSSDTAAWLQCGNLAFAAPSTWNALATFPSGWILFTSLRAELTILAKSYLIQSAFSTPPCSIICVAHITTWNYAVCLSTWLFLAFPTAKWASLVAQMARNLPLCGRPRFNPWVGKIFWRKKWQPTTVFLPGEFHSP